MARRVQAIAVSDIDTTGVAINGGGPITVNGFILTETAAQAGILLFCSETSPVAGTDQYAKASSSSAELFRRTFAASADIPALDDHMGFFLQGGLYLKISTGTATVSGIVLVS